MISIIMPVRNRANVIGRAIESVLKQTYREWELIIVDDASTDDTISVVKSFQDPRIVLIENKEHIGANAARNIGMSKSAGQKIAFLDSDNAWYPNHLEILLHEGQSFNIVFSRTIIKRQNSEFVFPPDTDAELDGIDNIIQLMLVDSIIDTNTVLMDRKIYEEYGGFDVSIKRLQDWDYFLGILLSGLYSVCFIDKVLCENFIQQDSISNQEELFFKARLKILKKYQSEVKKYRKWTETATYLLTNENSYMYSDDERRELVQYLVQNSDRDEAEKYLGNLFQEYCNKEKRLCELNQYIGNLKIEISHDKAVMDAMLTLQNDLLSDCSCLQQCHKNGYSNIALYGYGRIGKILAAALSKYGMHVSFIIDKSKNDENYLVVPLEKAYQLPVPDLLIVTLIGDEADEIARQLKSDGYNSITISELLLLK